jgi:hypothetical protein
MKPPDLDPLVVNLAYAAPQLKPDHMMPMEAGHLQRWLSASRLAEEQANINSSGHSRPWVKRKEESNCGKPQSFTWRREPSI